MKYLTAELTGALLDAAVAKVAELSIDVSCGRPIRWDSADGVWRGWNPSTDWRDGGPIIEREGICLQSPEVLPFPEHPGRWYAGLPSTDRPVAMTDCHGPSPLIAAMRAYVRSKFGPEVEL